MQKHKSSICLSVSHLMVELPTACRRARILLFWAQQSPWFHHIALMERNFSFLWLVHSLFCVFHYFLKHIFHFRLFSIQLFPFHFTCVPVLFLALQHTNGISSNKYSSFHICVQMIIITKIVIEMLEKGRKERTKEREMEKWGKKA